MKMHNDIDPSQMYLVVLYTLNGVELKRIWKDNMNELVM
jgi:hypothetical protein